MISYHLFILWLVFMLSFHETTSFLCSFHRLKNKFSQTNHYISHRSTHSHLFMIKNTNWMHPDEGSDLVISIEPNTTTFTNLDNLQQTYEQKQLLDEQYQQKQSPSRHFSSLTLHEISVEFRISIHYLGDFLCAIGIEPPISIDTPLQDYLTVDQTLIIMEAIYSQDPAECNDGFGFQDIRKLAQQMNISLENFLTICQQLKIDLPFGLASILHRKLIEKIKIYLDYEKDRQENEDNEDNEDNEERVIRKNEEIN